MNTRQEQLLKYVIDAHVSTGEPVGSTRLVAGYGLPVSSATVRHDLLALEAEGYLTHPHTSAGRVPTAAGYRYYVDRLMDTHNVIPSERSESSDLIRFLDSPDKVGFARNDKKELARALADLTDETVIVVQSEHTVYYTGIKNLFAKPEFAVTDRVVEISALLDDIDDCLARLYDRIDDTVRAHIGDEGAFGSYCSTVSVRVSPNTAYVLLGPLRMRYDRNMALLKGIQALL